MGRRSGSGTGPIMEHRGMLDKWFPVWGKLGTYAACDLSAGRARRWSR